MSSAGERCSRSETDTFSVSRDNGSTESVAQNIARNSSIVIVCQVMCQACSFFVTWILARHLQPRMFGLLTFAFTYISFFEVPAALGTNAIITRELSHLRGKRAADFWRSALMLRSLLLSGALLAAAAVAVIQFHDEPVTLVALLWVCPALITSLRGTYITRLRAHMHADWSAMVTLGRTVLYGGLVVLIVMTRGSVGDVIRASLLATLLALWVDRLLVKQFEERGGHAALRHMGSILRASWPLALSSMLTIIQVRIDVIMLRAITGDVAVGIYAVALKPAEAAYVVSAAIGVSAFPHMARTYHGDRSQFNAVCRDVFLLLLVLSLPVALILSPLAEKIIPSLFGEAYTASGQVLAILCLHVPLGYINMLLVNMLICANRQRLELWASIATTATNVVANALLIPAYGVVGAAVATLLCQCVALVMLAGMTYREVRFPVPWFHAASVAVLGACSMGTVLWLRNMCHWLMVGVSVGALYIVACLLVVYRHRWHVIRSLLRRGNEEQS